MTTRSLADALRAADDEALAELLGLRPELVSPVPADLTQLAARATTAPSVARALDRLDRWTLQVLEAACAASDPTAGEPATYPGISALLPGAPGEAVRAAVDRLLALALLWGEDDALHVVVGAREIIGAHPAGLGPALQVLLGALPPSRVVAILADLDPAAADAVTSPGAAIDALVAAIGDAERLAELLQAAPPEAASLLGRLTWGPPVGAVDRADREVSVATATSPVDWLLARGLLVAADPATVVLPREVALHLRAGRAFADEQPLPPVPAVVTVRDQVDRTAGGQAFTFIRLTEDLLEAWGLDAPAALKSGGLGVRELRRAALALDLDEWEAALVIETAYVAGLIGPGGEVDDGWLPTPAYDSWRTDPPEERWSRLAEAWLRSTRLPGLVGSRDDRDRVAAALGPDLDRALAPEVRAGVLSVLDSAATGSALAAADVEAVLAWRRPRRPSRLRRDIVGWTLREAERLGITGQGALSGPGRALIDCAGSPTRGPAVRGGATTSSAPSPAADAAADALAPLLPEPVDHVLVQADLTAIAPGPLVAELAHALALMADVESTGGATVYRFTESSVRRALDAGRTAGDLHALLAKHSATPVPQPLTYLVDDMARRHGRIRVGAASSYLRCDDDGVLAELLADKRSAELRLRRLAPTVLAAQTPGEVVLERLRAMGFAPAAESADGAILIRRPDSRRAVAHQRPPRLVQDVAPPSATLRAAAVRALRAGDRATRAPRGQAVTGMASLGVLPRTAAAQTLSLLQSALGRGQALWVGYVDQHGSVTERVVDPIRLEGGYLTGYDHRYEEVRTFAVHRITGVAVLDPSPASSAGSAVDGADAADVRPVDETDSLPSDAQPTDVRGPA
jgi:Helicase conserved C-terminal domain/WYL domain